jgi:hypothetical protein
MTWRVSSARPNPTPRRCCLSRRPPHFGPSRVERKYLTWQAFPAGPSRLGPKDCAILAQVGKPWLGVVLASNLPRAGKGGQ